MNQQAGQIWTTLLQAELVQGAEPETEKLESPWYVKVLLGFSGWLAALFLLGFIGIGFEFILKSNALSFFTGAIMIGAAFLLLRTPKNDFFQHLILASSLAGQALIIWAIFETFSKSATDAEAVVWALVALLQILLAIVMPSFVHRLFSSFVAAFACSMALFYCGIHFLCSSVILFLVAWLWLNEFRYPQKMRSMHAIGYGLVLALIPLKGTALYDPRMIGWRSGQNQTELWIQPWMSEVLGGVIMLYVVWQLLQRYGQVISDRLTIVTLLSTLLLCIVSIEAPGITVGVVIVLLGFAGSNRVLVSLGIVSLLLYVSSYYYLLDATLLAKANTLFIVGLVMLSIRWSMLCLKCKGKESEYAE